MKQFIGYFEVVSSGQLRQIVAVSQETTVNEEGVVMAARKMFTLDTVGGEEVKRTTDPLIFLKEDGTFLKKVGYCQVNDLSSVLQKVRRRG
ncbi:hypothetical protein [Desulfosediminicola flagellatus]|uniref:hypothetical protein n=1 Tax=Desulfosediminicola flagellatus TaxID=2569541 RepID=UPI0010AD29EB|nr:hypothetical protein [Desulfosediminicola flagellatus]